MKTPFLTLAAVLVAAPAAAQDADAVTARLAGAGIAGEVTLIGTASGAVLVRIAASGVPEGWHGLHIHETGRCEGDFESAGGHVSEGLAHGAGSADGPHPGDLPNVHAGADGVVQAEFFTRGFTLASAGEVRVLDDDGSAVILHAQPDDYRTQPAGDAGARLACGVLEAGG